MAQTIVITHDIALKVRETVDSGLRVVEILIDMQAPGCQWLDLTPLEVTHA